MNEEQLSFEEAMERLRTITAKMEDASLPLSDLADLYKEGRKYYQFCKEQLDLTEKELIVLDQEDPDELR